MADGVDDNKLVCCQTEVVSGWKAPALHFLWLGTKDQEWVYHRV